MFTFSATRGRRALDFIRHSWAMTELHLGLHTDSEFGGREVNGKKVGPSGKNISEAPNELI